MKLKNTLNKYMVICSFPLLAAETCCRYFSKTYNPALLDYELLDWTSYYTAAKSFYVSAFGKPNHYFVSKLLALASNFPTFSVHLFINIKHHIFQQDFGWHAHIHLLFSLLRNKLVFFGTITGRKNQWCTFNSWLSIAWNVRTVCQLFLFSNLTRRIW